MGLLDYYRQFEGMSEEEVNARPARAGRRAQAQGAHARGDARPLPDDLAGAAPPAHRQRDHVRRACAACTATRTCAARTLRNELAAAPRHRPRAPDPRQRRRRAAQRRHARADRARPAAAHLVALLPAVPDHGAPRPRPRGAGHRRRRRAARGRAREPDTRVVALASPNDPTGELLATAELERLLDGLPDGVAVLLDESLVEFADAQPTDASLELLEQPSAPARVPQLLQGLGAGRACASATRSAGPARRSCWPSSSPTSASPRSPRPGRSRRCAAARSCSRAHVQEICEERVAPDRRAARARLRGQPTARPTSCGRPTRTLDGDELAARLARAGVLVAGGEALGEPRHVRIAHAQRAPPRSACSARSTRRLALGAAQPAEPAWRSSAPVVPSRILRQALTSSGSRRSARPPCARACAEISIPWRSAISW